MVLVARLAVVTLSFFAAGHRAGAAQDADNNLREAAKHFQQGVSFYGEADYRSALIEFRRAGVLAPSAAVLYNVAETEYQLRDYAAALKAFERYLASVGPTDAHRTEVEGDIRILRQRVGRLNVATVPAGADVTIDDQPVGRTPFAEPLVVNVGHLKVVASAPGHLPMAQYVDVAAEDNAVVSLELARPTLPQEPVSLRLSTPPPADVPDPHRRATWRRVAWIGAGVAAVGAITFGVLANRESNDLQDARAMYPANRGHLDDLSNRTTAFAILTDALAVTAIAAGAWAFFSSDSSDSSAGSRSAGLTIRPSLTGFQAAF